MKRTAKPVALAEARAQHAACEAKAHIHNVASVSRSQALEKLRDAASGAAAAGLAAAHIDRALALASDDTHAETLAQAHHVLQRAMLSAGFSDHVEMFCADHDLRDALADPCPSADQSFDPSLKDS